ncbi:alpha-galactosidase [Desulfopila aestuarii]|uniref:Alpha-galactosidase n=1 Tax=Desulfopila aestuarii DSM 18488 TaxID=1121416 RepID=A0A1M7XWE2_9BACT|nr:alpha-galactosidase [Desulfopila aestuarii]SHO43068.1 alpha-galactosidase [Desulfopila aestuarii DSM 18488]
MKKIAIIGAGSTMFTRQILSSLYCYRELAELQVTLEDLDQAALSRTLALAHKMLTQEGLPTKLITATTNQKEALTGADCVINCIQVGGLAPWKLDIEIPRKYNVDQEVGDTLGPGGIFRALRQIPPMLSILDDMERLCPDALFINYANPLAPLTWAATQYSDITSIGLCYGVTYTVAQLAGYLGFGPWVEHPHTPEAWDQLMYSPIPDNIDVLFGGINHMTWILQMLVDGVDRTDEIAGILAKPKVLAADGVRCEILRHFGYWSTENHWHCSDYVPYFRKNAAMIERFVPHRWNLLQLEEQIHRRDTEIIDRQLRGEQSIRVEKTVLNAPKIIHAMCTGQTAKINGNIRNNGLISNLPPECIVEVPIFVDRSGLHPTRVGTLPPQCAALNRSMISVQELIVEAALNYRKEAAFHAICLDPLTAAVCTLDEIAKMFDELWQAQQPWLQPYWG